MVHVVIEGKGLTVREVVGVAREGASVSLSPDARLKIAAASGFVESPASSIE
jgi:histidine ammonia-lyase